MDPIIVSMRPILSKRISSGVQFWNAVGWRSGGVQYSSLTQNTNSVSGNRVIIAGIPQ